MRRGGKNEKGREGEEKGKEGTRSGRKETRREEEVKGEDASLNEV